MKASEKIYWNRGWWIKSRAERPFMNRPSRLPENEQAAGSLQAAGQRGISERPKGVILAAGSSFRLRPLTDTMPKCLLNIGDKSMLERTIEQLLDAGIQEIALVVGYRADMIREFVKQVFPAQRVRFILNPNYPRTNNAYSLLLARRFLEDTHGNVSRQLLLLDSDIVFSHGLLPHLLHAEAKNKIAVRICGGA